MAHVKNRHTGESGRLISDVEIEIKYRNYRNYRDQKLCVINGGTATKYFSLGRGAHQGDSISAFLLNFISIGLI